MTTDHAPAADLGVLARRNGVAYQRLCQMVDGPMLVISIAWLPVFIVPIVWPVTATTAFALSSADYTIWALFAVEYLAKLVVAPDRLAYVKSHKLDLLTVAIPVCRPLRVLRAARVLQLSRLGAVAGDAMKRGRALLAERGIQFVLLAATLIVFGGAGICLDFEAHAKGSTIHNYGDALWWAVSTISTVGYGDKVPVTPGGRGIAVVLMISGIGIVGGLAATLTGFFVRQKDGDVAGEVRQLREEISELRALLLHQPTAIELDPADRSGG